MAWSYKKKIQKNKQKTLYKLKLTQYHLPWVILTQHQKKKKEIRMNLTKYVQDMYEENCKTQKNKLK